MDLHSGTPFWIVSDGLGLVVPPIRTNIECDVAIIGAGITGALVADSMARAGIRTAVLDRRDVGLGSTVASTALLQYDTDQPLSELSGLIGTEDARRVFHLGLHAVERLLELARELDCPGDRRHSLYLCTQAGDVATMQEELRARTAAGLRCEWVEAEQLFSGWGIRARGAILSHVAGQVDPYRLCHALLRNALRHGAAIHDRTSVAEISRRGERWRLVTDRGPEVDARYIVHATGYESASRLPAGRVSLGSTYAFASEPTRPSESCWADRAMVWEHADPYLYARWAGDRLLVGGEDEPFADEAARDALIDGKVAALLRRVSEVFPGVDVEPAFAWTGTFATTADGVGYIGECSDHAGEMFALGFGGNGITCSLLAAEMLTAHVLGRVHPDARLFSFGRASTATNES